MFRALASPPRVLLVTRARRSSPRTVALALLLPVLAAPLLARHVADQLADGIAVRLRAAFAPVTAAYSPASDDQARDEEVISSETTLLRATVQQPPSARRSAARSPAPATIAHGVRVSAAQVLALAARRAMPQAVPVKANGLHPAGLLLRGVSALGIGMQDGDVLTEAAGQKASSVAAVVGAVLAARARQSPEISGRFYRAGTPFTVTVEQPYPRATDPG